MRLRTVRLPGDPDSARSGNEAAAAEKKNGYWIRTGVQTLLDFLRVD